jgi:hypothetical protein
LLSLRFAELKSVQGEGGRQHGAGEQRIASAEAEARRVFFTIFQFLSPV